MPERRGALETRAPTPSTLTVRGPTVRGAANTSRRTAHCVIHESALHDPERLRIELLDTLLIFLLTRLDRVPLHAATVCDADVGLVLFGPSGVGKSTLAHIAGRAGLQSLTDDITYVQLEPRFRLWGFARTPRPRARDADMRAPKPTVPAQPLNVLPPIREFAGVCLLERGGPQSGALRALSFEECLQRVLNNLEPGFDVFRNELEPRLRALTAGGAWLLQMPSSPDAAVPFLSELIAAVRNRRHLRTRERTDSRP